MSLPPSTVGRPRLSGVAQLVAVVGLIALVLSAVQVWGKDSMYDKDRSALDLTSQILWDTTPADFESTPIALLLVAAGLIVVVGLWRHEARWLILVGGLVALAVPLLYLRAVNAILDDGIYAIDGSLTSHLGVGVWIGLAAGVALVAAGVTALRPRP